MQRRSALVWLLRLACAVLVVVGSLWPRVARADLRLEEPRSGLHLDLRGGCRVKPAPAEPACENFAASAYQAERFAVVLGADGLLDFSVGIFTSLEQGRGEERARRVVQALGGASPTALRTVSHGGQDFLRGDLAPETGAAVVFVSIDSRPEVALLLFASDPGHRARLSDGAARAMETVGRSPAPDAEVAPPVVPEPTQPSSNRTVAYLFLGLLVVALAVGVALVLRSDR